MRSITIRQVPDELHEEIKKAAAAEGKSVNSHILTLLERSADERRRRAIMRTRREEFREFLSTLPRLSDSTELIREDRDKGHE